MRVKALTEPEKQMEAKRVFSAIEEMTCFEKAWGAGNRENAYG